MRRVLYTLCVGLCLVLLAQNSGSAATSRVGAAIRVEVDEMKSKTKAATEVANSTKDSEPVIESMVEGGEDPYRRDIEFWKQRTYPFDKIPDGAIERAISVQKQMLNRKGAGAFMAASPTWKALGPGNIGGRTRSVVCDPKHDGWVYAAAAGGGVWRSTDRGQSWTALFDSQNSLCMGAIAVDPNNADIIYAATGEISPASPMSDGWGTGVYKSVDAGKTWKLIGLTTVGAFSKIYVHPKNSNVVYAGGVRSGQGLYKTTDGGITWSRMNRLSVSDIAINPKDVNDIFFGVVGDGVYHTINGGDSSWKASKGFPAKVGRVSVQLCASDPKRLYCLIEGPNPTDTTKNDYGYVLVSNDGGETWSTKISADANIFGSNSQGYYDNYIMVHPTKPEIAYLGGIGLYVTTNGGSNWTNVGGLHSDQQAGDFNPLNPDEVYAANDGGMYYSASMDDIFHDINNGYDVTAFYGLDIDHTADNKTYGGAQDNGTSGSVNATMDWNPIGGGDGYNVAVSSLKPSIVYWENLAVFGTTQVNGYQYYTDLSTGRTTVNMNGIDNTEGAAWSAPVIIDRASGTLYHGRKRVYVQGLGSSWMPYSPLLDTSTVISTIGPSPVDDNYCFAGCENGNLYRTTNGGTKWENVTFNGLPKRFVRDVIPSTVDAKTAWVCYSGYGTAHVFQTTDAGASWKDISATLPDIPVNALCVNPDNEKVLFIGTDIGVFATFNGGQSWFPYGKGLPRAPVLDMKLYEEKNLLRIATHGRSMWEVPIVAEEIDEPEITSPAGGDVGMATSSMVFSWHGFKGAVNVDITFTDRADYWYHVATNVVGGTLRWVVENRPTSFARIRVTDASNASISVISNSFTILEFTRGSVKSSSSFSHVAYGISYDNNNGLWTTSFYTNDVFKLDATTLQLQKSFKMPKGFDNNFTDMCMDRSKGQIYIHRLTSQTAGASARILVVDTNGTLIRSMISPASYGIGLEFLDGNLIVGERDGQQQIYICNPTTADVITQYNNPFRKFYGPRCMSTDGKGSLFQVGTDFGSGGGLQGAYLSKIPAVKPDKETDRMELLSSTGTEINARGVEYDPRDGNYWITDLSGNIFKIANFDTPSSPLSEVTTSQSALNSGLVISPNPARERAAIGFLTGKLQAHVRLEVFNIVGERVALLVNGDVSTDDFSAAVLDCSSLPEGVYTVELTVDGLPRPAAKLIVAR